MIYFIVFVGSLFIHIGLFISPAFIYMAFQKNLRLGFSKMKATISDRIACLLIPICFVGIGVKIIVEQFIK